MRASAGVPVRAVLAAALCLYGGRAAAQRAGDPGSGRIGAVVKGTVTDSARTPIADVEVVVAERPGSVRTDSAGRFEMRALPATTYHVTLRHAGFAPISGTVRVADGDSLDLTFRLRSLAVGLDTVRVKAAQGAPSNWRSEFEKRRTSGFGVFITKDVFDQRSTTNLSEILRSKVSSLELMRFDGMVSAYNPSLTTPTPTCRNPALCSSVAWPPRCYMQVFLDGILQYTYTSDNRRQPIDLDAFSPTVIAAVEVYHGTSDTPGQFMGMGSSCGTIAIWTRAGEKSTR